MTSTAPLLPPGTGSLPPLGPPPSVTPPSIRPVSGAESGSGTSGRGRGDEQALPGRATRAGAGQENARVGEAPPLRPGRPLLGGGPFTLAVAFGLQADQRGTPETAASAGSPAEAAEVEARATAEQEQGGGANQLTEEEQQVVSELQQRDREVRQHEAAHAAAGGQYAGSPQYTYQRGPDGRQYAVGGSVSIDTSPVDGDPEATLQKARQIRAAALAPADPSAQDRSVASAAGALERQAQAEISAERTAELTGDGAPAADGEAQVETETVDATPAIGGPSTGDGGGEDPAITSDLAATAPAIGPQGESPASIRAETAGPTFGTEDDDDAPIPSSPYDLAGSLPPRPSTGFDGRTPPPQIISISV